MTLLNDKAVAKWFELIKNARTIENYTREFPIYMEFVQNTTEYKTPSAIIDARIKQLRSLDMNVKRAFEDIGIKYMHHLETKGYMRSTITTYLRTMLSFFSHNHVKLVYARKELLGAIEPSEKDKVIKEWIPSNEDVRVFYRSANNARDRAIILTLYQSGLSPVDVSALNIKHFNFYDDNGNWNLKLNEDHYLAKLREKSNVLQQTCLSREALEEIRIYLQSRGFPKEGSLFLSVHGKPITPRDINDICKSIVEKAYGKIKTQQFQTKNLRDSYMNGLVMAKIQQDVKDGMCGHQREGAKKDYDFSEETIKSLYVDAFKFLTINGFGSTNRKVEELEAKMNQDKTTLINLITEQQKRIDRLLNATDPNLSKILGEIQHELANQKEAAKQQAVAIKRLRKQTNP